MMRAQIILRSQQLQRQLRRIDTVGLNLSFRSFFASSTDHTALLQSAVVHRLEEEGGNDAIPQKQCYVMAADGMDLEMVKKVPQLHLARIWRDGTIIEGAKVVNSTLGTPTDVCGPLVDAALEDATKVSAGSDGIVQAKATLHGLSDWVSKSIISQQDLEHHMMISSVTLDEMKLKAIKDITKYGSECDETIYNNGKHAWEKLAQSFIESDLSEEAALYQSKGGTFQEIIHLADTTPYATSSGGSMALFSFAK